MIIGMESIAKLTHANRRYIGHKIFQMNSQSTKHFFLLTISISLGLDYLFRLRLGLIISGLYPFLPHPLVSCLFRNVKRQALVNHNY